MSVHQILNWTSCFVAAVVLVALLFQWLSLRSFAGDFALAAELDDLDDRVSAVVQKLHSRGRTVLANRIAGAHKRWMSLTEFDEEVEKTYAKTKDRRPALAQRLATAYGAAPDGEERGIAC